MYKRQPFLDYNHIITARIPESYFETPGYYEVNDYGEDVYKRQDRVNSDKIKKLHELGYLPIEIWALPEGYKVGMNAVSYTHLDVYKRQISKVGNKTNKIFDDRLSFRLRLSSKEL